MKTHTTGYVIPPNTDEIITEALDAGYYEEYQRDLVHKYVKPYMRVLEGGAGLGVVTRDLSERALLTMSCEPNPTMHHCANLNAPEALVLRRMLTARERVDLYKHKVETGDAFGVEPTKLVLPFNPNEAIESYNITALVLDIEGEEAHLLTNLSEESLEALELIIVEVHPTMVEDERDLGEAHARLLDAGFERVEDLEDRNVRHCVYLKD